MNKYKYIVRWTNTEGYRFSVTADSFINSQELVNALQASKTVRRVAEPEVIPVATQARARRRKRAA